MASSAGFATLQDAQQCIKEVVEVISRTATRDQQNNLVSDRENTILLS